MTLITRSPAEVLLQQLAGDPRLVHVERLAPREARFGETHDPLPERAATCLGVDRMWSHQAEAIDLIRQGASTVVATGTASGKSLCYQAPIVESVVCGLRPRTSLLVFPTKALAQDQLRSLSLMRVPRLVAATYDGDTGTDDRGWIRNNANVVLTNPEMLHHGILPHHNRWAGFLRRLRYVVIDELHVMRGIFGTHVAHLLRRLRRLCAHYGSHPTFVLTSATIGQPDRLASELCGEPVVAVTDDGSPRGERIVALWNPAPEPAAAGGGTGTEAPVRISANREVAYIAAQLIRDGWRTIVFCRSRKGTELVGADLKRRLPHDLAEAVRSYRGGYLPGERREIECELFGGQLLGVVATTALELGIDVGGLDACVLNGFPGTVASFWQQAGRAGRSSAQSLTVLVAGDDQLDQWLTAHPRALFTRPHEAAVINPSNPFVLLPHLLCAAYERPLTHEDERWWPGLLDDGVRDLVQLGELKVRTDAGDGRGPLAAWTGRGWPAHGVGLRNASPHEVRITDLDGTLVGTVDRSRAANLVHPGAIYLHQGRPWRVTGLDLDEGIATVEPSDGSEYTQPRSDTDLTVISTRETTEVGQAGLAMGTVQVVTQVTGYRRYDAFTGAPLGSGELSLPPGELITEAFWYTIAPVVVEQAGLEPAALPGALHAAEHAAIGIMPLFTICDRWDVGGISTPLLPDTGLPTIVIYDGHPGGAGIARLGFEAASRHLATTLDVIESCGCNDGCPSCVQSPKCGNGNEPLDKHAAIALLRAILHPRQSGHPPCRTRTVLEPAPG